MSVGEILSYVNALLSDWGIMPFIKAMMIIISVLGTIALIRSLAMRS